MPTPPKLTQVTDYLHRSIPLTHLEKSILSTREFNRLHNILQNSSVYLTYPSNRHTRFAHSLGAMHLAGEMFWFGFLNGSEEDQARFLTSAQRQVAALLRASSTFFDSNLPDRGATSEEKQFDLEESLRAPQLPLQIDSLLRQKIPGRVTSQQAFYFLSIFQAIRLAALLHDVGHPPFSHVVEAALIDLYEDVHDKSHWTKREENFFNIVGNYNSGAALHEQIGNRLWQDSLLASVCKQYKSREERFQNLVAGLLAIAILTNKNTFFRSLHEIVDGPLDADRLDYVLRDSALTGFDTGDFPYPRLLNSLRLIYDPKDEEKGEEERERPLFLPSIQALGNIEDFLRRRFDFYESVVFHHRVAKTDGLLRQAVIGLGKEYLSSKDSDSEAPGHSLPTDISGLWRAIDQLNSLSASRSAYYYMQWDDAWLLTVLRKRFFERPDSEDRPLLEVQLEEFISNRKNYYSLFKRVDTFIPIDQELLQNLDIEVLQAWKKKLAKTKLKGGEAASKAVAAVQNYHSQWRRDPTLYAKIREQQGLFIFHLRNLVKLANNEADTLLIQAAAQKLEAEHGLNHVFVVMKSLKVGLEKDLELVRGEEIIPLQDISQINEELTRRTRFFPGFFVYLYVAPTNDSRRVSVEVDLPSYRASFGRFLADSLRDLINL